MDKTFEEAAADAARLRVMERAREQTARKRGKTTGEDPITMIQANTPGLGFKQAQ